MVLYILLEKSMTSLVTCVKIGFNSIKILFSSPIEFNAYIILRRTDISSFLISPSLIVTGLSPL